MIKCNALTNGVTVLPTGKIMPCCAFDERYSEEDTGESRFVEIKHALDNDIQHPACRSCWECEQSGLTSLRQNFYNKEHIDHNNIVFLDIRNTNMCNLHCRMCSPDYSSTVGKDNGIVNYIKRAPIDRYINQLSDVKDLYFTGGEPLLNPDHWAVLESVKNPESIRLRYNSNLTVLSYKDKHIFDYWKKFKQVFFQISLEGYREINELVRIGSKWETIERNIDKIVEFRNIHKNLEVGIFICVNVLTLWDLDKLIDYANSKDLIVNLMCIPTPDWISLDVLPLYKRDYAKKQLELVYNKLKTTDAKDRIRAAINSLELNDESHKMPATIAEIQRVDRMYGINLFDKIKHNLL